MQVPRDLSRRMIEAVEQVPIMDVYERLVPESRRVSQRVDFVAWVVACAGTELQALGLNADQVRQLRDVDAPPDERWALLATYWPFLRATSVGRLMLRAVWELYGIEDVNAHTWKDISAHLWRETDRGYYQRLLQDRVNVRTVLVEGSVEPEMKPCCDHLQGLDRLFGLNCLSEIEAWARSLGREEVVTLDLLQTLIDQSVRTSVDGESVGFKVGMLPDIAQPSEEEVVWAFGRAVRCEDPDAPVEPALQTFVGHRLLSVLQQVQLPLQVHVSDEGTVVRLEELARRYPQVRFVGVYTGVVNAYGLALLARSLPNVSLALVGVWRFAPLVARQTLRDWLHSVPLNKIMAFGGGMAVVETAAVQAMIVRETLAALLAEMVAVGELDEADARLAMERLLYQNAVDSYGKKTQ